MSRVRAHAVVNLKIQPNHDGVANSTETLAQDPFESHDSVLGSAAGTAFRFPLRYDPSVILIP